MKTLAAFVIVLILGAVMMEAQGCVCPADFKPVCGTNGKTYSNKCSLGCAGATFSHDGECGKGRK